MADSKIISYRYPDDLGGKTNSDNTKCVSFMAIKAVKMSGKGEEGVVKFSNLSNNEGDVEAVITLPTPLNLGDTQGHSWSQETTVGAFEKISQAVSGATSKIGLGASMMGNTAGATIASGLTALGTLTSGAISLASEIGKAPVVGLISMFNGKRKALVNPGYFQNYTTSTPRTFEFQYTFYSRNQKEAIQVLNIIRSFKMYSAPIGDVSNSDVLYGGATDDAVGIGQPDGSVVVETGDGDGGENNKQITDQFVDHFGKVNEEISKFFGYMGQPNFWKITFGNKYLDRLLKLDYVVCTSVGVTYGNGSKLEVYKDGIPKIISLTLSFSEVKLKMREDFSEAFNLGDSNVNNEFGSYGYTTNGVPANKNNTKVDAAVAARAKTDASEPSYIQAYRRMG